MVILTLDERIDAHINTMVKIMDKLDLECGFTDERAAMLALAIQQNMILEDALLAAHTETPQPLEQIAIELKEIGRSEVLNYMQKNG